MQTVTKQSVIAFYLEYLNQYLTIDKMAEHYEMTKEDCEYLILLGQKYHGEALQKIKFTDPNAKENKAWKDVGYNH